MNYLGIDIGGTDVKIGIIDKEGNVLYTSKYSVSFDAYETPILQTVIKSIHSFLDNSGIQIASIIGIGVSATGQIDANIGKVIGTGGHIKNYCGAEIKKEIEEAFQLPCTVMNDANCMLLGEVWKGSAQGYKNVVAYTIGTGIGGGIMVDGRILTGQAGLAGELGHMSIAYDGIQCSCGNRGCFEKYASTSALVNNVKKLNLAIFQEQNIDGIKIFDQVRRGNLQVTEIVNQWIDAIACGTISLVHMFNPELIVIGGGISHEEDLLIKPLEKKIRETVMPAFQKNLKIKSADLGNTAGMIGAVYNFISSQHS